MKEKLLIVRADADEKIGAGHLMRCFALALEWKVMGGRAIFLINCSNPELTELIESESFQCVQIENSHPCAGDINYIVTFINKIINTENSTPWLILDGYHFDLGYQNRIKETGTNLLCIDDLANQGEFNADIVLNQNIYAVREDYKQMSNIQILLGTSYVLMRPQFIKYKNVNRIVPDKGKKILITLGGSDPDNVTLKVIKAIKQMNDNDLEIKVVAGINNIHFDKLTEYIQKNKLKFELIRNTTDMPELMAWADIAISAGGSTCWEMAFMGLPGLTIILAENQKKIAEGLQNYGISFNLGWYFDISENNIIAKIKVLIVDKNSRKHMGERGKLLVDGKGASRVIEKLNQQQMPTDTNDHYNVKSLALSDAPTIWNWGKYYNSFLLPWESYLSDFVDELISENSFSWILEKNYNIVAQVNYEKMENDSALINMIIKPENLGNSIGSKILRLSDKPIKSVKAA